MTKLSNTEQPLVSVCMITYNHEKYIAQAIESVLSQKTNFSIELVIGEDASTDNTKSIIKKYELEYPTILKVRCNKYNLGMIKNLNKTLSECKAKYIALLEGDDYWVDNQKLQKQIDFLIENKNVAICATNYKTVQDGNFINRIRSTDSIIHKGTEIFNDNIVPTLTSVFKNAKYLRINKKVPYCDWYLWAKIINKTGKDIGILNDITAVQTIHENGVFSSINNRNLLAFNSLLLKESFLSMIGYLNREFIYNLYLGYWNLKKANDKNLPKFLIRYRYLKYKVLNKFSQILK